jgi:hypothetical protein
MVKSDSDSYPLKRTKMPVDTKLDHTLDKELDCSR